MADKTALLTALLLERPLCAECIKQKSSLIKLSEITKTLKVIQRVLQLRHHPSARCHACGEEREVFSLERPS